ncbi:hypothetical protein ACSYAD_08660 [Acaryochloris marina NIES-2412]
MSATYIESNRDQGISIETPQLQAAFVDQSSITQQQRFAQVKKLLSSP